jgi:hypothetical protein
MEQKYAMRFYHQLYRYTSENVSFNRSFSARVYLVHKNLLLVKIDSLITSMDINKYYASKALSIKDLQFKTDIKTKKTFKLFINFNRF